MGISKKKIDAIYELREAAERKALAEKNLDEHPSPQSRDELLDTQIVLEDKTMTAIEICHDCGEEHAENCPLAR